MKVNKLVLMFCFSAIFWTVGAAELRLISPDKNITIEVILKEKIYYTVSFKGDRILQSSPLTLTLENTMLGTNPIVVDSKQTSVDRLIKTVWEAEKRFTTTTTNLQLILKVVSLLNSVRMTVG